MVAKTLSQWKSEVLTVQHFLDAEYEIDTWGFGTLKNFKDLQLPWGRRIMETFLGRFVLFISGGVATRAAEAEIHLWIKQAVEFGNASLIVSDDGKIRIPSPTSSFAQKTEDGSIFFRQEINENLVWAWNEQLYFRAAYSDVDIPIEDAQIFTLFYNEDNLHPYGQSRLTSSTRRLTSYASRVLYFSESVIAAQSHKQLIISNMDQDAMQAYQNGDSKGAAQIQTVKMGIHDALVLGQADNGETKVSTIDPTDPTPLLNVFKEIAATVASSHNIEPREFGIAAAVAPSAEAQHEAHRGLILEVSAYSRRITRTVLAALVAIAETNDEETPEIFWGDPAITSIGAAVDAFQKKVTATPFVAYLKTSMIRGGYSPEEIAEAERRGYLGTGEVAVEQLVVEAEDVEEI